MESAGSWQEVENILTFQIVPVKPGIVGIPLQGVLVQGIEMSKPKTDGSACNPCSTERWRCSWLCRLINCWSGQPAS